MPIMEADWKKQAADEAQRRGLRPRPSNEQRSEALRAQEAINHPGFRLLQVRLSEHLTRVEAESKTAEFRLAHGRGVTPEEMHRLREDIACCSGWMKALRIALETLPEAVKVVRDADSG